MRNIFYLLVVLFLNILSSKGFTSEHSQLLKNRFRVDAFSEDITLWINKNYQSPNIILIRPDGSKLYHDRHDSNVTWFNSDVAEIITLKQPMAGPWQILGEVVEGSKLYMVSEISIEVDPLPASIYQNEKLLITARVLGDELPIKIAGMDFLLNWQATLIKPEIFQGESYTRKIEIGGLKDDGQKLDAIAYDGIFTSDFNIDVPAGDYQIELKASNELFSRSKLIDLVIKPVPFSMTLNHLEDGIDVIQVLNVDLHDKSLLKADSKLQVSIDGPDQYYKVKTLNFDDVTGITYQLDPYLAEGGYILRARLFTTTVDGRELIIDAQPLNFSVSALDFQRTPERKKLEALKALKRQEQAYKLHFIEMLVFASVVLFCGLVLLIVWLIFNNKKKQTVAAKINKRKPILDLGEQLTD
ncbi:choice-of-anchor X domain-containing protein [Paraferrimonas sp. SM1919]|uniref:choice-of-anchor X domain-containing protein n=1 Tax=Paraferrimonas sp. SM1919 TaxID=2662263 RepID=UPI0013D4DD9C|nr:choice-of-anchor X domain-containing protein [Paraferrimonas sp. SM1919]